MGLSETVGGAYSAIEEKFYGLMDFLSDKGVPTYSIIDPLEERGIPAFPAILALIAIAGILLYGLVFLNDSETTLLLSITDDSDASVSQVSIVFRDEDSGAIDVGSTS
ncbi:MAG: hypothetical protein NUV67_01350, partial [archaeon]|nr:hypothetical protein [archaeon]